MTAVSSTVGAPAEERAGTFAVVIGKRVLASLGTIVLAFVIMLLAWTWSLKYFDVSKFVGKSPRDVWQYLFSDAPAPGVRPTTMTAEIARSQLFEAWKVTVGHTVLGFAAGLLVALFIASLFVLFASFEFAFMPIALLLRSVPLVAMAPAILLIFGHGILTITVIASIVVLFPALVNVVLGLRSASQQSLDLVRVYGGSDRTALLKVRIPSSLPNFFAAVRISLPGAVVGAMLGEWLSAFTGMGGMLSFYKGSANFTGVWAIVCVSVLTSVVLYSIGTVVEAVVLARWGPNAGRGGSARADL